MNQDATTAGAIGELHVATLVITVTPLSQAEELALDRALRAAAEAHYGDHYTRCKPLLDAMRDSPGDRLEAVREIVRLSAVKAPISAAAQFDFECTPEGLAIAIYARGKRATDGLTLAGLRAIITAANADQVAAKFFELTKGGPDKKSPAA